jgi:hypothetical protein
MLSGGYKECFFTFINADSSRIDRVILNRLNVLVKNADKRPISIIVIDLYYFARVGVDNSIDLKAKDV